MRLEGASAAVLARRWRVPHCRLETTTTSTLDVAHALGASGAPAGSVVVALEQSAGRGRDGRAWHSPRGGAWLGVLLRPEPGAMALGTTVSIRVGLIVADVVDEIVGGPASRLKWPNDILLRDRKLAGVLCEGRWLGDKLQWLAVGIGMNVANALPAAMGETAIALNEMQPGAAVLDVLDRLVPPLTRLGASPPHLTEAECAAFAARDWLRDRALQRPVAGRAAGMAPDGALLVNGIGGVTPVREGHVELA